MLYVRKQPGHPVCTAVFGRTPQGRADAGVDGRCPRVGPGVAPRLADQRRGSGAGATRHPAQHQHQSIQSQDALGRSHHHRRIWGALRLRVP
eukprot:293775-Chlamydomonas_euryale.AAC.1